MATSKQFRKFLDKTGSSTYVNLRYIDLKSNRDIHLSAPIDDGYKKWFNLINNKDSWTMHFDIKHKSLIGYYKFTRLYFTRKTFNNDWSHLNIINLQLKIINKIEYNLLTEFRPTIESSLNVLEKILKLNYNSKAETYVGI